MSFTVRSLYRPKTDASFRPIDISFLFFLSSFVYLFIFFVVDGTLCFMQWILKQSVCLSSSVRVGYRDEKIIY